MDVREEELQATSDACTCGSEEGVQCVTTELRELKSENAALKERLKALEGGPGSDSLISWVPLVKVAFSSTLTSMVLFVAAEWHFLVGDHVRFGALVAVGGICLIVGVPAVHFVGWHVFEDYVLFQPFKGGIRFVVLQALSWTFYALTACIIVGAVAYAEHTNGLLASAGVIGILSQVFMVSSLLTFDTQASSREGPEEEGETPQGQPTLEFLRHFRRSDRNKVVKDFMKMNTGLVLVGGMMTFMSEYFDTSRYRPLLALLSAMCCLVAVSLSHGIGGHIHHPNKGWAFSQSFRGGKHFVLLQTIGWSCFAVAMAAQGALVASTIYVGTQVIPGAAYIGAVAALVSHFVIVYSLGFYNPVSDQNSKASESSSPSSKSPFNYRPLPKVTKLRHATMLFFVMVMSNTQFISFTIYMILLCLPYIVPSGYGTIVEEHTFGLVPVLSGEKKNFMYTFWVWWMNLWAIASWTFFYGVLKIWEIGGWRRSILLSIFAVSSFGTMLNYRRDSPHYPMLVLICSVNLLYMSTTFTKRPETNGCREWPELRYSKKVSGLVEDYFGLRLHLSEDCSKVADQLGSDNAEDPRLRKIMVLFHPHSIFPISHASVGLTSLWKAAFPNLRVNPLTASIIHMVPAMRDVFQWFGICDCSKETVIKLLDMGRNVQIVCGGQSEMFESRSWDKEIVLIRARRLGVFKIAIQKGLAVMPVFSFGETLLFDNFYMPRLQAFTKKHFGFPFPFFMLGALGLPIPRRVPISICVGAPVMPLEQDPNPPLEAVKELQMRYFTALEKLFEDNKVRCGHPDHKIKWLDS